MPTIFFRDFKGKVTSAEATEQKDLFVVAAGPHAGNWPKERANRGGKMAFFTTWAPAGTGIDTLVKVEGHRWAIEDSFETVKTAEVERSSRRSSWSTNTGTSVAASTPPTRSS